MHAFYPNISKKEDIEKPVRQLVPIYESLGIDYLYWVKIGDMILAGFMLLWSVALLLGNWRTFINLLSAPTVQSVCNFGFAIIFLLISVFLVVLSVVLFFFPSQVKSSADDLQAVLISLLAILLVGAVFLVVWGFKTVTVGITLSIMLTFFYPIASGAVTYYILYVLLRTGVEPEYKMVLN